MKGRKEAKKKKSGAGYIKRARALSRKNAPK